MSWQSAGNYRTCTKLPGGATVCGGSKFYTERDRRKRQADLDIANNRKPLPSIKVAPSYLEPSNKKGIGW